MQVLQIMLPLRYDFLRFGGSWAQRQVFSFTMIQAATKTNNLPLALALVTELKVSHTIKLLSLHCIIIYIYLSLSPPPSSLPLLTKAQKPLSKRLKQLFDELKTSYDRQAKALPTAIQD